MTARAAARVLDAYRLPAGSTASFHVHVGEDGSVTEVQGRSAAEAYYSNAYRACALAKARPLASLPVHVYRRDGGLRVEADGAAPSALSLLLRTRWNPFTTAQEGFRWLDMTKDAKGEAFCRVEYADGLPRAIWPMASAPVVEVTPSGGAAFRYGGDKFTPAGRYLQHEVVWVKSPVLDADGVHGVSLAELAAGELGLSIDLEEFYSRLITNGNHFPMWVETPNQLSEQSFERLKRQLAGGAGITEAGRVRIFDNGLTVRSAGYSMADMSLVEQERWILQQTCRTLSVPPQEVFDLSHATYSNIEQGALNFANKTLVPECAEIERAFSGVLWALGETDCYVQFDLNGLLRGNYRDRMEGYRIAVNASFMCPNEVRAKEELPPYEGGDLFVRQASCAVIDPETGESSLPERGAGGRAALEEIHADMRARVSARLAECGDGERFREFATRVLAPYARACALARVEYDIEDDIEEMVRDEAH